MAKVDWFVGAFDGILVAHGVGGRPRLGVGPLQLVGDLVKGVADDEVGVEEPFAARPQLLYLYAAELAAPGEVREDFLSQGLGRLHRFLVVPSCRGGHGVGVLAGCVPQLLCVSQCTFSNISGDRFGFRGLRRQ
jgi:hypothetical protein